MSHRVDATVDAMEAADAHAPAYPFGGDTRRVELAHGHDAVLSASDLGNKTLA